MTAPPGAGTPYGVYRAEYVDRGAVSPPVHHADGRTEVIAMRAPLGTFVHARSGDKGGDANLGLWVAHDGSPSLRRAHGAGCSRW